MKTRTLIAGMSAALALAGSNVLAQPQGPGGPPPQGGPGTGFRGGPPQGGHPGGPQGAPMMMRGPIAGLPPMAALLHHPEVQKEIGIEEGQLQKIHEMMMQSGPGGSEPRHGTPPPGQGHFGPPQGAAPGQGFDPKAMEQHMRAMDEKIKSVLTAPQAKRLREIQIQAAGAGALFDAQIQKALNLNGEQREKIEAFRPKPGRPGQGGPQAGPQGGIHGGPPQGPPPPQGGPGQGGFHQGPPPPQGGPGQGSPRQGGQHQGPMPGGGAMAQHHKEIEAKLFAILSDKQRAELKAMGGKEFKLHGPGR